jgi:2-oxoglutarate ferredoxin oxidoreductase subunit alpha
MSLKQEAISYMAGSDIPAVIVNMSRGGPGLGDIGPSQGDYFQSTRGGGHGDYRLLVLAPSSAQEAYDMTHKAFDLAFAYRSPVLILGDAIIGQMKEPIVRREPTKADAAEGKEWRLGHDRWRKRQEAQFASSSRFSSWTASWPGNKLQAK